MSKRMNAEEGIQREVGMEFSQPEWDKGLSAWGIQTGPFAAC